MKLLDSVQEWEGVEFKQKLYVSVLNSISVVLTESLMVWFGFLAYQP